MRRHRPGHGSGADRCSASACCADACPAGATACPAGATAAPGPVEQQGHRLAVTARANQELILLGGEDPADPPQSRGKDLILFKDHPPRVMLQAKSNGEKIAFFLNAFQESEYVGLQIKSDFSTPPSEGRWSVRSGNYVDQSMRQQQQQQQIRRQDGTSGAFVAQACHADHLTGADALGSAAMPTRPRPRCQLRPQRSLKVAGSTRRSGRQRHRLQPGSSSTATALDAIISGSVLGTVRRRRRPHPVVSQSGKTPHFQKMHANAIILQAPPLPPLGGLPQGGSDAPACGSRGSGLLGRAVCAHQGGIGR